MKTLSRDNVLKRIGHEIGKLWCIVVGAVLLLGFPVAGSFASVYLWVLIADYLMDLGIEKWLSVSVGLMPAFFFGLFLSVYVWPYVKSRMFRAFDVVMHDQDHPVIEGKEQ